MSPTAARELRAALFVDFDNVYLGLKRLDPAAAEAFATEPGRWLGRLGDDTDETGTFRRRFLVRACYLNPSAFSKYRPNFTRAGFQVVDCPSLTQQGKSSADINLVLDAVDALAARTRYDEFVIVSADADFTPLALRCRADDRRVTIITASPAAAAYRAVADAVVTADGLAELVGAGDDEPGAAGAATLVVGPATPDPIAAVPAPRAEPAPAKAPKAPRRATAPAAAPGPAERARAAVLRFVLGADRPVPLGAAAQAAIAVDPTLAGSWSGAGSFSAWLGQVLPELGSSNRAPGYVWDPERFGEADLPGAVEDKDPSQLQRQVVAVTDVPGLSATSYGTLLRRLADDLAQHPFDRATTSRRVRDACQAAGAKIGRSTVSFVLNGVLFAGLDLVGDDATTDLTALATAWADNVVGLCRGARMELTAADEAAIRAWVSGGLVG